jgi:hypothetical protein
MFATPKNWHMFPCPQCSTLVCKHHSIKFSCVVSFLNLFLHSHLNLWNVHRFHNAIHNTRLQGIKINTKNFIPRLYKIINWKFAMENILCFSLKGFPYHPCIQRFNAWHVNWEGCSPCQDSLLKFQIFNPSFFFVYVHSTCTNVGESFKYHLGVVF